MIEWEQKFRKAKNIENYLNDEMKKHEGTKIFNYSTIANDLNLDIKIVRDILFPVDGGFNGITIEK